MPISRISAKVILVGRAGAMMPPLFATIGRRGSRRQLGSRKNSPTDSIAPDPPIRHCNALLILIFSVTRLKD